MYNSFTRAAKTPSNSSHNLENFLRKETWKSKTYLAATEIQHKSHRIIFRPNLLLCFRLLFLYDGACYLCSIYILYSVIPSVFLEK